ncbi:hypothetical protein EX30DRAFT_342281 [Ascodesmis nigricans]|uniref:Uncharacterized protein n=1 Tax=Ascodesmis nigricans TaxID=341454 RepID=A0A4S2MT47_9PEZI|nr:hypothetical protein EX30DRAFT_342281 [Ascodesmis nigricans]
MVWPFSSTKKTGDLPENHTARFKEKDSFYNFDPWMKDFLEKEAPIKPSRHDPALPHNKNQNINPARFSKYGDKYADIWAQYKTPEEIDAEYRTPAVAVNDVLQSYKNRKIQIGKASMENCVFQQDLLYQCYADGTIKGGFKKMSGCTEERAAFDDCFKTMQRLLHTLGYGSDSRREPEVDERIQMHADRLYREQVKMEKAMEREARAAQARAEAPSQDQVSA